MLVVPVVIMRVVPVVVVIMHMSLTAVAMHTVTARHVLAVSMRVLTVALCGLAVRVLAVPVCIALVAEQVCCGRWLWSWRRGVPMRVPMAV
mmetsp:Transcript_25541/g.55201  ORF Transcript_25541/g.55201 Transcript_25541/m.55201 type:complete len:91 (+) Transcript_25541:1144-1416(+)